MQCNSNDSFALAIKLLRHDPVSIWLRTRMNNIFQCVLCCGFRSRNLSTWQQKLQETARAHVSFQSICPIFGQPHQTLNKVWNILPCFSPTSLNAEQDFTKWKIFNLAIMPRSCSQIVCLWLHIVIFVFVFLQLCISVISVFAPRLIRFPSNFIILALWCTWVESNLHQCSFAIFVLCVTAIAELQKCANRANQLVLFFLAGANFWEKHAKTGENTRKQAKNRRFFGANFLGGEIGRC